jgi:hypothetical protein
MFWVYGDTPGCYHRKHVTMTSESEYQLVSIIKQVIIIKLCHLFKVA